MDFCEKWKSEKGKTFVEIPKSALKIMKGKVS